MSYSSQSKVAARDLVRLNQVAQGVLSMEEGVSWFAKLDDDYQLALMQEIAGFVGQAHPREQDVDRAIKKAELKATFTPCVLAKRGRFLSQLAKIVSLPPSERVKSFTLLVTLLGIADERRRNSEASCHHWWHRNIADTKIVKQVIAELEDKS